MTRSVAVSLVLLLAAPSFAATLGPERRVSLIAPITRAANSQTEPAVASDGHGFVACWTDTRESAPPGGPFSTAVYATHFDRAGNVEPLTDVRIARGAFSPRIASNQSGYVVAFATATGLYTQQLDRFAKSGGPPSLVDSAALQPLALASDGSGYLLIARPYAGSNTQRLEAYLLDSYGRRLTHLDPFPIAPSSPRLAVVTTKDGAYHLIHVMRDCYYPYDCGMHVVDFSLNARTGAVATRTFVEQGSWGDRIAAAADGNRILLAFTTAGGVLTEQIFTSNGAPVTERRSLPPDALRQSEEVLAGWDGSKFLILSSGRYVIRAIRTSASGDILDDPPFTIGTQGSAPALAFGGGEAALVYAAPSDAATPDIFGSVLTFDEMAAHPAFTRVSNAPAMQSSVAAAEVGGGVVTVWRENDGNGSIVAAAAGHRVVIAAESAPNVQHDPDIAAVGSVGLIAWRSDDPLRRRRVLAMRVGPDGAPLDREPLVIDDASGSGRFPAVRDRVSIATSGREFLVVWSGDGIVEAKRVGLDGSLVDARPIAASAREYLTAAASVKAVWTGDRYLIFFAGETHFNLIGPSVDIAVARVTADGIPLESTTNHRLFKDLFAAMGDLSAAVAGDRVVLGWMQASHMDDNPPFSVRTMVLPAGDLTPPASVRIVEQRIFPFAYTIDSTTVSVAAHAGSFVVAWSYGAGEPDNARATLLDAGEPFTITSENTLAIAVTPVANGFTLTYARVDAEAANVSQLFSRDLVPAPARRRAVR